MLSKSVDLNSKIPFLHTTIATLVAAILDPILELFKVESKKKKFITLVIGVSTSFALWFWSSNNINVADYLKSLSKRGVFSAMSITLLMLNLAYINYQLLNTKEQENQKLKEESVKDKEKILSILRGERQ